MENTVNSNVSVERILELQESNNSLNNIIVSKEREMGAYEAHIETLNEQVAKLEKKLEEKTPEIRIIKGSYKKNCFDQLFFDHSSETIEYRNLSSIQDDIRKEVETKFKKDLESNEKTIKDLNKKIEIIRDDYDRRYNSVVSDYNKATQDNELQYQDKKLKLDKKLHDKDLEIEKIREELEKVKNDKTDEQVAKQREEEITKLKLRIKDLEKTVKEIMNMNFFKRFWNSITNKAVRVAAEKEVIEKQNEIDKIKGYSFPISGLWLGNRFITF